MLLNERDALVAKPLPSLPPTLAEDVLFGDVEGNAHAESIRKVAEAGIASGYSDGTFRPGAEVTRGQMATFLARALKLAPVDGTRFADAAGSPHEGAINAVAQAGITLGNGRGGFGPNETVSRAQMATFLVRAFALPASSPGWFVDTGGSTHAASIDALAKAGISQGDGQRRVLPGEVVNRGQMATFLARALEL